MDILENWQILNDRISQTQPELIPQLLQIHSGIFEDLRNNGQAFSLEGQNIYDYSCSLSPEEKLNFTTSLTSNMISFEGDLFFKKFKIENADFFPNSIFVVLAAILENLEGSFNVSYPNQKMVVQCFYESQDEADKLGLTLPLLQQCFSWISLEIHKNTANNDSPKLESQSSNRNSISDNEKNPIQEKINKLTKVKDILSKLCLVSFGIFMLSYFFNENYGKSKITMALFLLFVICFLGRVFLLSYISTETEKNVANGNISILRKSNGANSENSSQLQYGDTIVFNPSMNAKLTEYMQNSNLKYLIGEVLLQKYKLLELIVERPLYSAFLSYDRLLNKPVIIKIFDSATCNSLGKYCAFNEFNVLNFLEHPSIAKAENIFEFSIASKEYLAVIEEYVQGEFLSSYLQNNLQQTECSHSQKLSEKEIIDFGIQICDILIYFDSKKIQTRHRDIRPDNFILQPNGKLKLIDAEFATSPKIQNTPCSLFKMGALGYTSPTVYGKDTSVSKWQTDTYSVGATMYALSTGTDILGNTSLLPVHKVNPNISTAFSKVISKSMKIGGYKNAKKLKKALLKCSNK